MKSLFAQLAMLQRNRSHGSNIRLFTAVLVALLVVTVIFMVIFRVLMLREGIETTWITAFYWVLTVMSTLGFGDLTFHSDLGRVFSMVVLVVGMFLLLVLLPFLFIEFFYVPWSESRRKGRVPREIDPSIEGHVLITGINVTADTLRRKLQRMKVPHFFLLGDDSEALRYYDQGWQTIHGDHDLPASWIKAGVERAALVAAIETDAKNAHVAFTVRELNPTVPVVAIAHDVDSVDVLELAGATEVVRLSDRLGEALARRVTGIDTVSHAIGELEGLIIAEASARDTELMGKTLKQTNLRPRIGISVVGLWQQGQFLPASANLRIEQDSVLVMVGTKEQFVLYDETFGGSGERPANPVLILGGGRVGRATARTLQAGGLGFRIVEKVGNRVAGFDQDLVVVGNAADRSVLDRAGLQDASAVVLTTHDDDINVFLAIYCRKLRPDIQILSRSTRSRNVQTLYRAGADLVLSYATMGADAIYRHLDDSSVLTIAEGLTVFRVGTPESLWGRTLAETQLRPKTGASVIAVETTAGRMLNPDPLAPLPEHSRLVLIGSAQTEAEFMEEFG